MADRIPARLRPSSQLTPAEGRRFAWTVGAAFGVLAAVLLWRGHAMIAALLAALCVVLAVAGSAIPRHLGPVYRGWMGLAQVIARVTGPVFLGLVYFGVLTPVGIAMRLLGRNPLRRPPAGGTYWLPRDETRRGTMTNQF